MPMILPLIYAAVAGLVLRTIAVRRIERVTSLRLPLGADGIVKGAGPITLHSEHSSCGVLLIHGFGDTAQSMSYLAAHLHGQGCAVTALLLPGHGRTLRAFSRSRQEQWVAAAREELASLCGRYDRVSIAGLSMGGAIATVLAAERWDVASLVLMAPYLNPSAVVRGIARMPGAVGALLPYIAGTGRRSIRDSDERARNLAYRASPPRVLRELTILADRARALLPRVKAPTLILQSREDHRVPAQVAEHALKALGCSDKRLVWLENTGHVLTVDFGKERLFELVTSWILKSDDQ